MSFDFSWYRRANKVIAQGSLTNSKRVETLIKGVSPTHALHGRGPYLYDDKKKEYVDFIGGLGSSLFGYAHPAITRAVSHQLEKGAVFSIGSTLEVEAAEELINMIPFSRRLRFLKTGTEACLAAIRIARAHTGREEILSDGYHGWSDPFVALTEPALGVPRGTLTSRFVNLDQVTEKTAAVIIEPVITDWSKERLEELQKIRERCTQTGAVLIFDEIITGFRWPKFTFSSWSGISPDILCLGKALGGGLPLSAVLLSDGIGDGKEWFVSSTFAGDTLALAGFMETKRLLFSKFDLGNLWHEGEIFQRKFNELAPDIVQIEGYPTRGVFRAHPQIKALFFQECHKAGILVGPSFFFNFSHINVAMLTLGTFRDVLSKIRRGSVKLEGEMPATPFAQSVRGK